MDSKTFNILSIILGTLVLGNLLPFGLIFNSIPFVMKSILPYVLVFTVIFTLYKKFKYKGLYYSLLIGGILLVVFSITISLIALISSNFDGWAIIGVLTNLFIYGVGAVILIPFIIISYKKWKKLTNLLS